MPDEQITAARLGRVIVQAGRRLDVPFGQVLDRRGITRNAWWLLTELYRTRAEEPATVGEHARRSGLPPSSATAVTEQLARADLARRWRPHDNRRVAYVVITDVGAAFVESVRGDLEKAVADLYVLYDEAQRRALHDLLLILVDAPRESD
ncbi:MarR family winged helix-turn-helix transcriptional regulator [Actinoplanes sp. HUAS TT8]|uniref:MarR family winged helix-turn-helix transcriptional regulator n=1 Tax=Actinoplanes sp. HUAS TT8 TaxID=3447453 RepID=UPI003F521005